MEYKTMNTINDIYDLEDIGLTDVVDITSDLSYFVATHVDTEEDYDIRFERTETVGDM
jgi:hypothetical protein